MIRLQKCRGCTQQTRNKKSLNEKYENEVTNRREYMAFRSDYIFRKRFQKQLLFTWFVKPIADSECLAQQVLHQSGLMEKPMHRTNFVYMNGNTIRSIYMPFSSLQTHISSGKVK